MLDRKKLVNKLGIEEDDLIKQYNGWVKEALHKGNLTRDAVWSSNIATGKPEFVEKIKRRLHKIKTQGPRLVSGREQTVWEEPAEYGQSLESNMLEWKIESENSNYINR
mgnify:CR=1 FL=1